MKGMNGVELARELKEISPGIEAPLISKMEKGLCEPTEEVKAYIDARRMTTTDKIADLTPTQTSLMLLLMTGTPDRPISRTDMILCTNQSDGKNRKDILAMRDKGLRICASTANGGYWIARSDSEYKHFRGEYVSRIKSLVRTLKAMDENVEGQIRFDGN